MNIKRVVIFFVVFLALALSALMEYVFFMLWINGPIVLNEPNRAVLAGETILYFILVGVCAYALQEVVRDKSDIWGCNHEPTGRNRGRRKMARRVKGGVSEATQRAAKR